MKRSHRDEEVIIDNIDLANCLITLSHPREIAKPHHKPFSQVVEFECNTCNRKFSSFQALGGHRTSHKKPKQEGNEHKAQTKTLSLLGNNHKQKIHECSICGQKFTHGQALGGHMRKHKVAAINQGFSSSSSINQVVVAKIPVLKRSNSSRRVLCLDLNLTPLQNDLKVLFGNRAPKIDSFL